MQTVAAHILESVDEIIGNWITLQLHEPWVSLPLPDLVDHLPAVIAAMVHASLSEPESLERHRVKVAAAAEHGRQRRESGFDDDVVFQEYYGIRNALWKLIRPSFPGWRGAEAMLRLDTAISVALRASLVGFHADTLPEGEELGTRLEELAAD